MSAVQKLCNLGIFLRQGQVQSTGKINQIVDKYLEFGKTNQSIYEIPQPDNMQEVPGYAYQLQIEDIEGKLTLEIPIGKPWQIRVLFRLNKKTDHFIAALGISNSMGVNVRTTWSQPKDLQEGWYEALFKEEYLILSAGTYHFALGLSSYERTIHYIENVASIDISDLTDESIDPSIIRISGAGLILNPMKVRISQVGK
jgi:hypothetical protein